MTSTSISYDFNVTYEDVKVDPSRTRLAMDLPLSCLSGTRPPTAVTVAATSSAWSGTKALQLKRRGVTYLAAMAAPANLAANGTALRISVLVRKSACAC